MLQFAFGFEGLETISSEHLQTFSTTFGRLREVAVKFSEILVMMRQKSHTFDTENVGRHTLAMINSGTAQLFKERITLSGAPNGSFR